MSTKLRDRAIEIACAVEQRAAAASDPIAASVYWRGAAAAWREAGGFRSDAHARRCDEAARAARSIA